MLAKGLLICKTRTVLSEYVGPLAALMDQPRRRFLRQAIGAVLLSGSLVVSEFARWIKDECSDRFYQIKRLLNHLVSPEGDLTPAIGSYRRLMARHIEHDTPILIDITDIAKPRARRMKYLAMVRDASQDRLVNGYWCLEVYAHLKGKRVIPLAMDVFSVEDPATGSQNLQIERTFRAVNEALNGKGIWVADRGFDGLYYYETWFLQECNFVVRQRGDRFVVTGNGVNILERDLMEHIRQNTAGPDIVWAKVHLPNNDRPLYLVAAWRRGEDEPIILLTTMVVENLRQARGVLWYYSRRWACEEATRFLKNRVGLERFCIRRYEAIRRLAILAMFAMGFLTWILLKRQQVASWMFSFTGRFRKQRPFIYYRLLDGLQEFARLHYLHRHKLLPPPL